MTPHESSMAFINGVVAPYGRTAREMCGRRNERDFTWVRQMAYARYKAAFPASSLPHIGRVFGGRDHTTILHGIRAHQARMAWVEVLRLCANMPEQPDLFSVAA